jgi:hypothetical protein
VPRTHVRRRKASGHASQTWWRISHLGFYPPEPPAMRPRCAQVTQKAPLEGLVRFQPPIKPSQIMERLGGKAKCCAFPPQGLQWHIACQRMPTPQDTIFFFRSLPWPKSPFFIGVSPKGEWHIPPALAPHSPRLKEPHLCKALLHKVILHSLSATLLEELIRRSYSHSHSHSPKSLQKAVVIENACMVQQDVQRRSHALRPKYRT